MRADTLVGISVLSAGRPSADVVAAVAVLAGLAASLAGPGSGATVVAGGASAIPDVVVLCGNWFGVVGLVVVTGGASVVVTAAGG